MDPKDHVNGDGSDPLQTPPPFSLCTDLPILLSLSSRGQWTSLLTHISTSQSSSSSLQPHPHPHHRLIYLSFSALSHHKLRNHPQSLSLISSLLPFDSPNYLFSSYPNLYPPSLSGSFLPFSIRLLHSDLPQRMGDRQETLDRYYSLLDFIRSHDLSSSPEWARRESFVLYTLCCNHFAHKEYDVCFSIYASEIKKFAPADLVKLGYIQLQIGDLDGAKQSFALAKGSNVNLDGRNRALEYVVEKDYVSAAREYGECVERDGTDVVAVNNKALCLMYLRDLGDSIKILEGALERVPTAAVNETVVVNLCSMYELAYVNHGEVKKNLNEWIAKVAPEDFDSSCTRI